MKTLTFTATMEIIGINPFVPVNRKQADFLKPDWRRPMPVLVRVNGQPQDPWHINMMPVGDGNFFLYLHGDVRKASGTKVGDLVTVELSFDEAYMNGPQHPIPDWFQSALDRNGIANENWLALSPSRQKEILRYFSQLKSDEAKLRNLEKVMNVLEGRSDRFMGRPWKDGK